MSEHDHPTQIDRFVVGIGEDPAPVVTTRRRLYTVTTVLLSIVLGLAVFDGLGLVDVYGVDSAWSRASGDGYDMSVRYATVSRPGLATPFDIAVERLEGFDGPVTVGVTSDYFAIWDENGFSPQPSSETTAGEWTLWEFDPPEGVTLSISYDARIEPAAQSGRSGRAAVFVDGDPVVEVSFSTRVMP